MDKDKILVSVVIDKQALIDRAFAISKTPSEFNELKKVIDGKRRLSTAKTSLLVISTRLMMKARRRIIRASSPTPHWTSFSVITRNWQSSSASIRLRTRRTLSSTR